MFHDKLLLSVTETPSSNNAQTCLRKKCTVKPVLSSHSKIEKTKMIMTNGILMKVKSFAECSSWSILQYFWAALSNNRSWKPIFGLLFEWPLKTGFFCTFISWQNFFCLLQKPLHLIMYPTEQLSGITLAQTWRDYAIRCSENSGNRGTTWPQDLSLVVISWFIQVIHGWKFSGYFWIQEFVWKVSLKILNLAVYNSYISTFSLRFNFSLFSKCLNLFKGPVCW